ncbi:homoserine acetyltransferase [Putridiphycobacter roseus]|uniref:Homoserine acetyltransferase n=1 Tax=Putridiphycobacter roseus TaxID=2219161 RepID=A0A2W1N317_9FLAO|nr:alpha/beta fold hydrolase [Putridiphycobacter roseus]PZE17401.1 homoserine acetyltransferase [Putridiphycobacter roseus]
MDILKHHKIHNYQTTKGVRYSAIPVSYQVFGQEMNAAPVVVINHALTGNSDLNSPDKGWWREIVGANQLIDTNHYCVIAFNVPGNGYDGFLIEQYKDFSAKDIAIIYQRVLNDLNVKSVFAILGGSIGGGIAWEMACLFPDFAKYVIPIASDWKASDWIIGQSTIQESILLHANKPMEDARKMAMLFYRTPASFKEKFNRLKTKEEESYAVVSWLDHHGEKLKNRFELKAYLLMNHLLSTIDAVPQGKTIQNTFAKITATIVQISIESDLFFVPIENYETKKILDDLKIPNQFFEIKSIHGHDAFLLEHQQITEFLAPIFKKTI